MGREAILENYFGTEVTAVREAPGLENIKRRPFLCFNQPLMVIFVSPRVN